MQKQSCWKSFKNWILADCIHLGSTIWAYIVDFNDILDRVKKEG